MVTPSLCKGKEAWSEFCVQWLPNGTPLYIHGTVSTSPAYYNTTRGSPLQHSALSGIHDALSDS